MMFPGRPPSFHVPDKAERFRLIATDGTLGIGNASLLAAIRQNTAGPVIGVNAIAVMEGAQDDTDAVDHRAETEYSRRKFWHHRPPCRKVTDPTRQTAMPWEKFRMSTGKDASGQRGRYRHATGCLACCSACCSPGVATWPVWHDLDPAEMARGAPAEVSLNTALALKRPAPVGLENIFDLRGTSLGQIDVQLGVVGNLSDARFSPEAATMGMWEPVGYMKAGRAGVFFLEPYDPARTPVLFVHGIRGTPRSFSGIIDALDRSRFQAWVLNYPSGLDLRALGDGLVGLLAELRHRYGFGTLHIVSHSMGGLLVREYLAECARAGGCEYVGSVVSISTPFAGIAAMGSWLEYARVVMPVWRNLAPDGPFLRDLFALPLPSGVSYHLLFGYRNASALSRGSGDGVIPLESQLRLAAQNEAVAVRGFNEDHVSILGNEALQRYINDALQRPDFRNVARHPRAVSPVSRTAER